MESSTAAVESTTNNNGHSRYTTNVNVRDEENRKYQPGENSCFSSDFTNILAAFLSFQKYWLKQHMKDVFDIFPH